MGDSRRFKKQYSTPSHPFQKARIDFENEILREYGLKNKTEVWKANSKLKSFAGQAKRLIAAYGNQAEVERKQLFARLERVGLLKPGSALDDVLSLRITNLLDRRLQTIVFKKGLARSVKAARQFISHAHVSVNGKIISAPGYIVGVHEENTVSFIEASSLSKEDHPERGPKAPTGTVVNPNKDAESSEEKAAESTEPKTTAESSKETTDKPKEHKSHAKVEKVAEAKG